MGVLDFLFEGQPPKSVTTYGQTVESMPKWYSDYTQGLIARSNAIAAEPYQPYGGPRIAGFSPDQTSAFDMTRQNVGSYLPGMDLAQEYTSRGANASPLAQASPYFSGAMETTQGAIAPGTGAMTAAAPYLSSANRTFPGAVEEYMSPYSEHVIDRAGTLARRQMEENIMPSLEGKFVRGGQYGSSAHMQEADRAARDLSEGLHEQSLAQLDKGYGQAGQLFGADMSRMGALGQLAGQLTGADTASRLQAGQQMGALGAASGQLAGEEGKLALEGGAQTGTMAEMLSRLGIKDAASLEAIGREYQGLGQRNLDLAYGDFQQQRDFPRTTVDWMSSVIRGMQPPTATSTTNVGPSSIYQPSPLAQLAALGSGLAGYKEATGNARGGRIRRYRRGGRVSVGRRALKYVAGGDY